MAPRNIKNVAVIGLGKLGNPISRHLLNGGFVVSGFDIDPKACKSATCKGIAVAPSAGQAVTEADLVIILVAREEDVAKVLFAPDGVAARAKPDTIVGIATTISPESMIRFGQQLRERGLQPIDMPICRGERPAEAGKLLITGGGDKMVFDACRGAFSTFASSIYRLGDLGSGQVGKMVNNLILWSCVSANHEGFKLAGQYGVDDVIMREMLLDSNASNGALETQVQRHGMPSAERDMMIVLTEADRLRVSLPLSGSVKEIVKAIKIESEDQPLPNGHKS